MSAPQNMIAIVYDYDQTLSPSYMQEAVVFPAFGIKAEHFWWHCSEMVCEHGYDSELAYMKVLLDQLGMGSADKQRAEKTGRETEFLQRIARNV
jgi:hypothetical protein